MDTPTGQDPARTRPWAGWLVPPGSAAGTAARPGGRWLWIAVVFAVVVEAIELSVGPTVCLGVVPIGSALIAGPPLAVAVLRALPAASSRVWIWRGAGVVWALAGAAMLLTSTRFGMASVVGLMVAGAWEELVFRAGLVGLVAAALSARSVRRGHGVPRGAWAVAATVGALTFAFAPGHVAQMQAWWMVGPFLGWAWLMTLVLWRTGDVVSLALTHGTSNLATLALVFGTAPLALRSVVCAGAVITMVYGGRWAVPDPRPTAARSGARPSADPDAAPGAAPEDGASTCAVTAQVS